MIARLLYSIGETQVTEYPDFSEALQDILSGSNHDYVNMTLMDIELETGRIGTTYDGRQLERIANDSQTGNSQ